MSTASLEEHLTGLEEAVDWMAGWSLEAGRRPDTFGEPGRVGLRRAGGEGLADRPVGGLEYISQVRAPLPDMPVMPTGGVQLDEVTTYLQRGVIAVGLGGPLLGDSLDGGGDVAALGRRARAVIASLADL